MSIPMRMQQRRGTPAEWASVNPTLAEGEIGYERGTGRFKVGDGATQWNALGYATLSGEAVAAEIAQAFGPVELAAQQNLERHAGIAARKFAATRTAGTYADKSGVQVRTATKRGSRLIGVKDGVSSRSTIHYSDDSGTTWNNSGIVFPNADWSQYIGAIVALPNGELIITAMYQNDEGAHWDHLYRTSGFNANPATATVTMVFETPYSQLATGPSRLYGGLAAQGSIVAGAWYGKKTNAAGGDTSTTGVYVRASLDGGANWATVFRLDNWLTSKGYDPVAYGYHVHGIAADPWAGGSKFVVSFGDTDGGSSGLCGVLQIDVATGEVEELYVGRGPWQSVGMIVFATGILMLGDGGASSGVNAIDRRLDGTFTAPRKVYSVSGGNAIGLGAYRGSEPGSMAVMTLTKVTEGSTVSRVLGATSVDDVFDIYQDERAGLGPFMGPAWVVVSSAGKVVVATKSDPGAVTAGTQQLVLAP